jgi:hypothetical protein
MKKSKMITIAFFAILGASYFAFAQNDPPTGYICTGGTGTLTGKCVEREDGMGDDCDYTGELEGPACGGRIGPIQPPDTIPPIPPM